MAATPNAHVGADEYAAHVGTYSRFKHVLLWFCIHAALILMGVYVLSVLNAPITGVLLLGLGVVALAYGVITAGDHAARAMKAANPPPPRALPWPRRLVQARRRRMSAAPKVIQLHDLSSVPAPTASDEPEMPPKTPERHPQQQPEQLPPEQPPVGNPPEELPEQQPSETPQEFPTEDPAEIPNTPDEFPGRRPLEEPSETPDSLPPEVPAPKPGN